MALIYDEILNVIIVTAIVICDRNIVFCIIKSSGVFCTCVCTYLCCVLFCHLMHLKVYLNSSTVWPLWRIFGRRKNFVCDYSFSLIVSYVSIRHSALFVEQAVNVLYTLVYIACKLFLGEGFYLIFEMVI